MEGNEALFAKMQGMEISYNMIVEEINWEKNKNKDILGKLQQFKADHNLCKEMYVATLEIVAGTFFDVLKCM